MTTRRTRDEENIPIVVENPIEVEKPRISALAEDLIEEARYEPVLIKKVGAASDGGVYGSATQQFYMFVTSQPFYVQKQDAKVMVESGEWEYGESQPQD